MLYKLLICIIAGAGAGLGTGFAGLSAAVFITPMLIAFLNVPSYEAVGIALASDVLASAISAWTYSRDGKLDIKSSRTFMTLIILFAIIGSIIAYLLTSNTIGNTVFGYWTIIATVTLGITFLIRSAGTDGKMSQTLSAKRSTLIALMGAFIGLICGFQGTGGGVWMLFSLTVIMEYEFKTAVGTSVFIMTFTALIGAIAHFYINGMPDMLILGVCMASTVIFARLAAKIATKNSNTFLNKATGITLIIAGIIMLLAKIFIRY